MFVGCEATEGIEPAREVADRHDVGEVGAELVMAVVMEAFDVQREIDPPDRF